MPHSHTDRQTDRHVDRYVRWDGARAPFKGYYTSLCSSPVLMSNYFDQWPQLTFIRQRDGGCVLASDVLRGKRYLLLYFAPPWHGGTRRFTPKLKSFYEAHHESKSFEVLYIARGSAQPEIDSEFLGTNEPSLHGSYYALAEADMETVAVPLLHHFRVFTYPSLLVLDNQPEVVAELRLRKGPATPLLFGRFSPLEGDDGHQKEARGRDGGSSPVPPPSQPGQPPATAASREKGAEDGGRGRPKATPRIAEAANVPRLLCLTGCFMLEQADPTGEGFPWTRLAEGQAAGRFTFLSIVAAVLAVTMFMGLKYIFPALMASERAKKQLKTASPNVSSLGAP